MLKGIEAVIFDLDGTLIDSMWMWKDIDKEYLGRFGLEVPDNLTRTIEGMSFTETAFYFKEQFHIADNIEDIKKNWNEMAWHKYEYEVPLKKGVRTFLELLKEKKIVMGIATSNSKELVYLVLKVHNIQSYFTTIVTGCDVKSGKPSPDIYLQAALNLKADPARCLVFEDVLNGIYAGKSAGMCVCAVRDQHSMDIDIEKRKCADYYIEDYEELTNESGIFTDL